MSTAEASGGSSSPGFVALGEILAFFGTVADYAAGAPLDEGERVASLAVAMGRLADLSQEDLDALYYAARLRNAGALGNASFAKGDPVPERTAAIARQDIPADGARLCERIDVLPASTADIVRWQAECWDGTGFPDRLRWSGIPAASQFLHIAQTYVATPDPGEAFTGITAESGRSFTPEYARTFAMWFHMEGGEIANLPPPESALRAGRTSPNQLVEMLSVQIDAHNGTPLRAQRIARRSAEAARILGLSPSESRAVQNAALLFGIGEIRARQLESQQFDPLGRLGIQMRADHATAAAEIAGTCPVLADAAQAIRSRAEWYDGTGKPDRTKGESIPRAGHLLAATIAFDTLDETYRSRVAQDRTLPITRLETVSGTQFDPGVVQAVGEAAKTHT